MPSDLFWELGHSTMQLQEVLFIKNRTWKILSGIVQVGRLEWRELMPAIILLPHSI